MRQFKILFTIFISSIFMSSAYASTIDNIQAVDNKTIKIAASADVIFSDVKVYGEVKVLRDIAVSDSVKDLTNAKKVTINLANELSKNSSYSLIGVLGAEGNIEFEIGDNFGGEILNQNLYNETKIIEKVVIINSKTIEAYYNYNIKDGLYEFKLLSELYVDSISSVGNNVLNVNLSSSLEKSASYILMLSSIENIDGVEISLNESLYDFSTNSTLVEKIVNNNIETIKTITPNVIEDVQTTIEEVSLNAAETPDTGAETWFVMLLTFIFTTTIFIRKRFSKA